MSINDNRSAILPTYCDLWKQPTPEQVSVFNGSAARRIDFELRYCTSADGAYLLQSGIDVCMRDIQATPDSKEVVYEQLENFENLQNILPEIIAELKRILPSPSFTLEHLADPEQENAGTLLLFVSCEVPPHVLIRKLIDFGNDWWVDHMRDAEGMLVILPSDEKCSTGHSSLK